MKNLTPDHDLLKSAVSATPKCLSVEDLGRYADGAGEPTWRERSAGHIKKCAHCQTELSLMSQFQSPEIRPEERDSVQWINQKLALHLDEILPHPQNLAGRSKAFTGGWSWKAFFSLGNFSPAMALASLLIVASAGAYLWTLRGRPIPELGSGTETGSETLRSVNLTVIGPRGDVGRAPTNLSWQPTSGAVRYEVRLMEVDQAVLWNQTTASTSVDLPAEVRAQIVPAKTLFWEVEAFDRTGAKIATSGNQRFRLSIESVTPRH